jgi:hypothetical protein
LIGGRPKATPVVKLYTFFIPKARIGAIQVQLGASASFGVSIPAGEEPGPTPVAANGTKSGEAGAGSTILVPLRAVAHARSGDKGNSSNIAIFCRKPEYVPFLRRILTPDALAEHFAQVVQGPVRRYEAPGLDAFNFVLEDALGGGGMASARIDSQGKAYGQRALEMKVAVPAEWDVHDINPVEGD